MRYNELSDEDLQAKAEEAGVAEASSKTREQLVAELAKLEVNEEEIDDRSLVNTRGDFSSPNQTQGEDVSAADEAPREGLIPDTTAKTGEIPPADGEEADQSSLGGTGGTLRTDIGTGTTP